MAADSLLGQNLSINYAEVTAKWNNYYIFEKLTEVYLDVRKNIMR